MTWVINISTQLNFNLVLLDTLSCVLQV